MALDASLLTQDEYNALRKLGSDTVTGMSQQSVGVYLKAVAHAKAASRTRGEQGMAEAVRMMAEQGVRAYTYYRSDGTLVRVPGDVGIRRAVREQMRRASSDGALGLAESTGHDLVYIDETPACRDGHRPINGKAFSVTGKTPGYERLTPELESLLHDPGCQHRVRLYWPGVTETPEPAWRAEGYTDGEMRELQGTQRALENAVRKAKRSSEAVKAALAKAEEMHDAEKAAALSRQLTVANAKVRARQARVAEHVAAHSDVLTRQPWREALYDSARRFEFAFARKQESAVEKARKGGKPASKAVVAYCRCHVEKTGGLFRINNLDDVAYLDYNGVAAACLGDCVMLRENPTVSEVLEETYHYDQQRRGDYEDKPSDELKLRREIDAQKYLLSVAKKYKIPREETEQTKRALADYERQLEELIEGKR